MKILVTGTAGFIGFHLAKTLLERGDSVVGLDNINDYYDVELKYGRLKETGIERSAITYNELVQSDRYPAYRFIELDCADRPNVEELIQRESFDAVCHLAAQAGVRYSLVNPASYITSNIDGFFSILEACKRCEVGHLSYASSSSVYGLNTKMPFSVRDKVDRPISMYAATKKSNELMAHTYSYLFGLPTTGLRFFTVYGPWGRPDMALFTFVKHILEGKPIEVNNNGNMKRDFTYIDDIIEGVVTVIDNPSTSDDASKNTPAPYAVYNIGNGAPVGLMDFITAIEEELGREAEKVMKPLPPGDVPETFADVRGLEEAFGYRPATSVKDGISRFISWYKHYYGIE
jgi:UDP-glucuronate 4-epimerase